MGDGIFRLLGDISASEHELIRTLKKGAVIFCNFVLLTNFAAKGAPASTASVFLRRGHSV